MYKGWYYKRVRISVSLLHKTKLMNVKETSLRMLRAAALRLMNTERKVVPNEVRLEQAFGNRRPGERAVANSVVCTDVLARVERGGELEDARYEP